MSKIKISTRNPLQQNRCRRGGGAAGVGGQGVGGKCAGCRRHPHYDRYRKRRAVFDPGSDNGSGMGRDDALLALERYATSKIYKDQDLFRIHTLGFRGEALPSIAAVSRFIPCEPGPIRGYRHRDTALKVEKLKMLPRSGPPTAPW